ncbi:MAG: hypothetical protein A2Y62_01185 [Candidatus Fischerbacteria bacterium RBG_13_37_8]|uniref:non-specific serine/threonine protein kinase n=1 Tax=Candidatus Fischerbacteria bacterium RBG_13_37_8 TaxID=1817863 RepID=A0A1F5VWV3_9BACT|nr:MAG: hypothetical protein A2Y62_01185 [Candidatus Fischerbacteria bacterium RBG_13_37_8]
MNNHDDTHDKETQAAPFAGDSDELPQHDGSSSTKETIDEQPAGDERMYALRCNETWGKYRIEELIGAGGMGEVYKAYDITLGRNVALKLIRGNDPAMIARFMQEARSQAKVEHDFICKIYEVGEYEGKPYIAMQYIQGQTIGDAASHMTLEQKIIIMSQVASALHAAHREGLIHRDIKPGNIMVEQTQEGQLKPYIMDFGLAKETGAPGLTSMGVVMGTPLYMSPEQARGEIDKLDRRTDVYSLGAALYELLAGQPLFEARSTVDILIKVLEEEPVPLRKIKSQIPSDIETIVMKCVEKESHRRYESARALAEDLERYLSGDPIQARKTSLTYRVSKKIKKHRFVTVLISVFIVVTALFAGIAIQSRLQSAAGLRAAQHFGQVIKEMETFVNRSYLLPLHDITYTRSFITGKMDWVRDNMKQLGRVTEGPGHYALGRGYMAMEDYGKALTELRSAWDEYRYREPEAAYAMGIALAELYRQNLEEAQRMQNKDLRAARLQELDNEFRKPALQFIEQGRQAQTAEASYVEILLRYLAENYRGAIDTASSISMNAPWLYEAQMIAGDSYQMLANEQRNAGNYDEAVRLYREAETNYKAAIKIGRSDPRTYERVCGLQNSMIIMQIYQLGVSPQKTYEDAMTYCNQALQAYPKSMQAYVGKIIALWRWGEYQLDTGNDPRIILQEAIDEAHKAIAIDSENDDIFRNLATAYQQKGFFEMNSGLDPQDSFQHAIDSFYSAIKLNPSQIMTYNNLGICLGYLANWKRYHGQNPIDLLSESIEAFHSALRLNPRYVLAYSNLGDAFNDKAAYETDHGIDPLASLESAVQSFQSALAINPNHALANLNLGRAYVLKAAYLLMTDKNPEEACEKALASLDTALGINSNWDLTWVNKSTLYTVKAEYELNKQRNPVQSVNEARKAALEALRLNPNYYESYGNMATAELIQARWLMHNNQQPTAFIRATREALKKAMKINPGDSESWTVMAASYRWEADWLINNSKQADNVIDAGLRAAEQAIAHNPESAEAMIQQAVLYELKAQTTSNAIMKKELLERSQKSRTAAQKINQFIK